MENEKNTDRSALNKLNSVLLTICTSGILWIATMATKLETRMTSMENRMTGTETAFSLRIAEFSEMKNTQIEHTKAMSDFAIRLTRLEILLNEQNKK